MKAGIILCIACAFLISTGCSQSNKILKGYAYARDIMPAVKPRVSLNENGTVTTKHKAPGIQYYIYTETNDTAELQVKNIWIKGNVYSATAEKAKDIPLPIVKNSSILNRDNLDSNKIIIWQINVGEMLPSPGKSSEKPSQLKEPEVLISFLYKNKLQYFPISKLQYLEPMDLQ